MNVWIGRCLESDADMHVTNGDAQAGYWLDPRHLDYHVRQFDTPYRSTVSMLDLAATVAGPGSTTGLDVACGAGANLYHLGRAFPRIEWTGVDLAADLFRVGERLMAERNVPRMPRFVAGDAYRLAEYLPPRSFDLVFCFQTFLSVPAYEPLLESLLAMVKPGGWACISSLFTESLVDARIELRQYHDRTCTNFDGPAFYNVYCLDRFTAECRKHGAVEVRAAPFTIDQDLPQPSHGQMGTYTERLADGRRIQLSGPLLMPWQFVLVRLG